MPEKKRDDAADIAKGIGIIFVVAGHCGFELPDFSAYTFHMPLFFFISGFFVTSFIRNPDIGAGEFAWKRFKRLMLPFFLYNFISGILSWASQFAGLHLASGTFWQILSFRNLFIEPFLSGHQYQLTCPLWFVPSLFCALLFTALLRPVIRICEKKICFRLLFMAALIITYYLCIFINDFVPFEFRYLARNIIGCIYIILGYFFYNSRLWRIKGSLLLIPGLAIYTLIAINLGHISFSMWINDYGSVVSRYVSLPSALAGILLILGLAKIVDGNQTFAKKAGFIFFGKSSYHVMAIHFSFITLANCILCLVFQRPLSLIDSVYYHFPNCVPLYFVCAISGSYWYARWLAKIRLQPWKRLARYWETDPG